MLTMQVACRIRPMTEDEIIQGGTIIAHKVADDNMVVLLDPEEDPDDILRANRSRERKYMFDIVSDARAGQQEVYAATAKILLGSVLEGYNATVFAYGATGAGKTYTMLGTEHNPGVMYRTLHDLFVEIQQFDGKREYQVSMSYLEIYNELIRDLLVPSTSFLELREDAKGTIQVAGLSEVIAKTPEEVMEMLHKGNRARTQEPTKANKTSSRSHAVLQVNIKQRDVTRSHTEQVRFAKLYMIDLAGSERAAQTQNTGRRMMEGAHINRSLLALGNCINALSEKGTTKYVNYRDSKLTRILKDSLGGNSRTVMIAHVSPASVHFEESRNTLNYADRAKYIKTKIRRNVIDVSYHIAQYQQIIQDLRSQVQLLREQKDDLEMRLSVSNEARFSRLSDTTTERLRVEESIKLKENIVQAFKKQIDARRSLLEIDNALMDITHECSRNESILEHYESNKENSPRNKKQTFDNTEPENVQRAKAELKVLDGERSKLEKQRKTQMKEFDTSKADAKKLYEKVSKRLTSQDQRELLRLLTQNFEFELKNIELQADIFVRDFSIKHKDLQLLRMSQHRKNKIPVPSDLEELYQLYSRDIDEGQLMKDLAAHSPRTLTKMGLSVSQLPILSQIAEEDLTSASTSVTSFHLIPNNQRTRTTNNVTTNLLNNRALSDQELFTRVNENDSNNISLNDSSTTQALNSLIMKSTATNNTMNNNNAPLSYAHFNFDGKLAKGNSLVSISSESVDVPIDSQIPRRKFSSPDASGGLRSNDPSPSLFNKNGTTTTAGQGQQQAKGRLRKQTQDIAARAAQRRANLHHRELMEDLGYDPNISKENTSSVFGLEVTGMKPKKTVTIQDPAPGRNRQIDRTHDLRRTNSDSPELIKTTTNAHGSSNSNTNQRSSMPMANIVVPRDPF
ncbi:unnamed protein product [Didymodactylos carnosus]|uniref:Kinesin-like protein n=1 Tax=Didymodactylos carnosus TaxID=1234261 RepID=A0A813YMA7_9BILA|nr:unnamed protein product [Didymodactylos carnosus]CAF0970587.1 unnamed protein product [Didymodactylos carnosus]CAF3671630.1 unnamed protein product [Didymodactylos carnosus]CAF3742030.1 unnamed protein product [Didymodactylos carnosus]